MKHIVQLHTHSYYSLLEGLLSPARMVQLARQQSADALALTDHLHLTGAVAFTRECQAAGIKPILGLEVDVRAQLSNPPAPFSESEGGEALSSRFRAARGARKAGAGGEVSGPVVLLAQNLEGWQNLCRLTAKLLERPDETDPVCTVEQLRAYAGGLICLSGGRRSPLTRLLAAGQAEAAASWLHEVELAFSGRFFVEINNQTPSDAITLPLLADLARQNGLPLAASADIFYATPEQAGLFRTLAAIRANRPLAQLRGADDPQAFYPTHEAMLRRFHGFEEALENTRSIAEACAFTLPFGQTQFPAVPLPRGVSVEQRLRKLAFDGAHRLYHKITPEIQQRLEHELETIHGLGFEPIFLVMEEVMRFARTAGIPVSSRGSAASSLVAHCLGITNPDPIELNLYFERFLNPARATPPDIDTDLCSRRRDLVLQHVFDTYGASHVAMVGTINRYRPRSALADVAKAHGFSPAEVRQLAAKMPYRFYDPGAAEEEDVEDDSPYRELEQAYPAPRYQSVFRQARALLGLPRHLSIHAGGIVITPGEVTDLIPVQRSTKGYTITQFDHKMLEPLGIIKLDMLGIRGLTVLGDVAEAVHSWRRSEFDSPARVLEKIPPGDAETASRIENGLTIGCFQIESPGMRATLKEIHARGISDLIVALALYRPGPLTGGLKDDFVRRHNGQEEIRHLHPALAPVLEDTYGVILYQEQVLRIAHELAGFSLAESDLLRRAMSHFDPGRQMIALKQKFIRGAGEKSGVDAETAMQVWELMAAFAGYGFPKAHAASYALVAWQSAWCKTHFPAEFMSAVLANWGGYYPQRVYLMEARRMGLAVRPPHVNHARQEFSVAYPDGKATLYMGLDQVRDLTRRTQQRIIAGRPFRTLQDFLNRANPRREEASHLIRCGALEGLGSIPSLLRQVETGSRHQGQLSLFDQHSEYAPEPEWTAEQKAAAQVEILGASVDTHPLERVGPQIAAAGALTTVEAAGRSGQKVLVAGVKQTSRHARAASGGSMMFLSLEDLEGTLDVVVFPDIYRRFRAALALNEPLLIEGIMENDPGRDEPVLRAEKVYRVEH